MQGQQDVGGRGILLAIMRVGEATSLSDEKYKLYLLWLYQQFEDERGLRGDWATPRLAALRRRVRLRWDARLPPIAQASLLLLLSGLHVGLDQLSEVLRLVRLGFEPLQDVGVRWVELQVERSDVALPVFIGGPFLGFVLRHDDSPFIASSPSKQDSPIAAR